MRQSPLDSFQVENLTVKIYPDYDPISPLENDNAGHMVCFHKRYNLGDKHDLREGDFNSWDEIEAHLIKEKKAVVILPLYLYDHSGLRIKVGSFKGLLSQGHAEFDSGMVGFIYITKEEAKKEWGNSRYYLKAAEKYLRARVNEYDQYLSGDVYGYVIENEKEEELDSCWGFYGFKYVKEEAESSAKFLVEDIKENITKEFTTVGA